MLLNIKYKKDAFWNRFPYFVAAKVQQIIDTAKYFWNNLVKVKFLESLLISVLIFKIIIN